MNTAAAIETVKIRGRQGDWNAHVVDWGETLPCVYPVFWTKGVWCGDPNPATASYWFADHVALMRAKKRVILTCDKIDPGMPRGGRHFKRNGCTAILEIDDITVGEQGLRFRLVRRLANAR
jgi:hypothetical protein